MTSEHLSDEEIIACQHRKYREAIWAGLIGGLVAAGLTVFVVYADGTTFCCALGRRGRSRTSCCRAFCLECWV
jgi:hypothetical protein